MCVCFFFLSVPFQTGFKETTFQMGNCFSKLCSNDVVGLTHNFQPAYINTLNQMRELSVIFSYIEMLKLSLHREILRRQVDIKGNEVIFIQLAEKKKHIQKHFSNIQFLIIMLVCGG